MQAATSNAEAVEQLQSLVSKVDSNSERVDGLRNKAIEDQIRNLEHRESSLKLRESKSLEVFHPCIFRIVPNKL